MNDFLWLGLTKAEAIEKAAQLNLSYSFIDTKDPKQIDLGLIGKIICAQQINGQIKLTVGYFLPGI